MSGLPTPRPGQTQEDANKELYLKCTRDGNEPSNPWKPLLTKACAAYADQREWLKQVAEARQIARERLGQRLNAEATHMKRCHDSMEKEHRVALQKATKMIEIEGVGDDTIIVKMKKPLRSSMKAQSLAIQVVVEELNRMINDHYGRDQHGFPKER
jgi:hypothetical protein